MNGVFPLCPRLFQEAEQHHGQQHKRRQHDDAHDHVAGQLVDLALLQRPRHLVVRLLHQAVEQLGIALVADPGDQHPQSRHDRAHDVAQQREHRRDQRPEQKAEQGLQAVHGGLTGDEPARAADRQHADEVVYAQSAAAQHLIGMAQQPQRQHAADQIGQHMGEDVGRQAVRAPEYQKQQARAAQQRDAELVLVVILVIRAVAQVARQHGADVCRGQNQQRRLDPVLCPPEGRNQQRQRRPAPARMPGAVDGAAQRARQRQHQAVDQQRAFSTGGCGDEVRQREVQRKLAEQLPEHDGVHISASPSSARSTSTSPPVSSRSRDSTGP